MSLRCSGIAGGLCDGRLANHREWRNALGLSPTFRRGPRDPRLPSWRVSSAGPALVKLLCRTAAHPKAPLFHRGIPGLPSSAEKTLQRCRGRGLDPNALPTWSERSRVAGGPTNHHTDTDTDCCATQVMRWPRSRPTTVDNGQAHSCRRRLLDRST